MCVSCDARWKEYIYTLPLTYSLALTSFPYTYTLLLDRAPRSGHSAAMYRHAWESVLSFCNTLADLSRASRINHATRSAAQHMKPACFACVRNIQQLKEIVTMKQTASGVGVARHVACTLLISSSTNSNSSIPQDMTRIIQQSMIRLEAICVVDVPMNVESVSLLADTVKETSSITKVELCRSNMKLSGMNKFVATLTRITSLVWIGNHMEDQEVIALSHALATNTSLRSIYLRSNIMSYSSMYVLASALATNTHITSCTLIDSIKAEGFIALAEALTRNNCIQTINLGDNYMGTDLLAATVLAKAIEQNTCITALGLSNCRMADYELAILAEAFKTNTSVTSIDLECNYIGRNGIIALANALQVNTHITHVNLQYNSLDDESFMVLDNVIQTNKNVKRTILTDRDRQEYFLHNKQWFSRGPC